MLGYDRERVAKRIRGLREGRKWSLREMGERLNALIGDDALGILTLGGQTGRQTVAQLESIKKPRGITIDIALAYSHIFDVSLDFIFCLTDSWRPEDKEVKEATGLSNKAIETLMAFKGYDGMMVIPESADMIINYRDNIRGLNLLLENDDKYQILSNIARFLFCDFMSAAPVEKNTGRTEIIDGRDLDAIYLVNIQSGLRSLKNRRKIKTAYKLSPGDKET